MALGIWLLQGYCTHLDTIQNWIESQKIWDKKFHRKPHEPT